MAYHHVLIHHEERSTEITLLFKDLSAEELRTPFLADFIQGAQRSAAEDATFAHGLRARVIRTERTHDEEVSDYLRAWAEEAEKFMRVSGYPVNSRPMGDSAIAGAGLDITDGFLEALGVSRDVRIEEARKWFESWDRNRISLAEVMRVLALVNAPPNFRSTPLAGDARDRHFDAWFDGGAIIMPTGGASEYWLDDGVCVSGLGLGPRLHVSIEWPDGRKAALRQESDLEDSTPPSTGPDGDTMERY